MSTCEIKLFFKYFWNYLGVLFYFTRNNVWNWNKITSAAEGVLNLFQNYFSDNKNYSWATHTSNAIASVYSWNLYLYLTVTSLLKRESCYWPIRSCPWSKACCRQSLISSYWQWWISRVKVPVTPLSLPPSCTTQLILYTVHLNKSSRCWRDLSLSVWDGRALWSLLRRFKFMVR